ncbi:MAG: Fic family protein [Persicimonas sp.]
MSLTYLEVDQARSDYAALTDDVRQAFEERLVQSWLYHDHMLEGVVLTESDIHRAIDGRPCRNYCDRRTQKSLRRMRGCIHKLYGDADQDRELSLEWLRDLHERMCDDDDEKAGRYRQRETSPGVYHLDVVGPDSISYHFRKLLDDWRDELSTMHPIRAAALAHWEFMRVFPFDERTGIVGRLMMNYILIKNYYPPAVIHASDRHRYFGALDGSRAEMVPVVVEAIRGTIEAARAFRDRADNKPSMAM